MLIKLAGVVGSVFGVGLEIWLVIQIVVLLERSERKELLHQVTELARERSGRSWTVLLTRIGKRVRRAVSRWAWSQGKKKEMRAHREYKKLTWTPNKR